MRTGSPLGEQALTPRTILCNLCAYKMQFMKVMNMWKLVTSPAQAYANILRFEEELKKSADLQGRLAYARAWYAHKDDIGKWHFAPSKFAGYQDVDANRYIQAAEEHDGRRTEVQLQLYFHVLEPTDPLHAELNSALFALLARYGKTPSTKMRINVARGRRLVSGGTESATEGQNKVVDLMLAVSKTLPQAQFERLVAGLEDISA